MLLLWPALYMISVSLSFDVFVEDDVTGILDELAGRVWSDDDDDNDDDDNNNNNDDDNDNDDDDEPVGGCADSATYCTSGWWC